MGLFNFLIAPWRARVAQSHAREAAARRLTEVLRMADEEPDDWDLVLERQANGSLRKSGALSEEISTIVNTRAEGAGWEILGSAWKGHIARDQQIMIAQARRFFRFDPNAQATVYALMDYMMGGGVNIVPKSDDPRQWKAWRRFWTDPENRMAIRQFEIIKRFIRDGEVLIRKFTKDRSGQETGRVIIRFIDPIDLQRGAQEKDNGYTDKTNQGIEFDSDDAEKPLVYHVKDRNQPGKEHQIPAAEVLHVKFPVADMDQARGESALQAIMDLFTHYKQWLKNRIILNKLRTAIFAVREIDPASGAGVANLAATIPGSSRSTDGDNKKQNIRPGTLYTPPPGVKLRMESPNINAADVKEDGRNMKLEMAAGSRLPEFAYGDASNANYSSTMMAESPFVKHIAFLRAYLDAALWEPLYAMVMKAAVDANKLVEPAQEDPFADTTGMNLNEAAKKTKDAQGDRPDKKSSGPPITESAYELFYGCDITWPEMIHREPKDEAAALAIARQSGWVSDETAAAKLGFDYAEEVRKQNMIEEEAEKVGNALLNHTPGAMAAAAQDAEGENQDKEELAAAGAGGNRKKGGQAAEEE